MPASKLNQCDKAPNFALNDQTGKTVKLSDFRGKKVILYFYPKDDTPGCTREACNLRDNHKELKKKFIVLGVSMDPQESHRKFTDKYGLPFPLLADTKGEICRKYGVYIQKNMYGRKYWGIKRTTFMIDENGKIERIISNVDVDGHAEQILGVKK